MKVLVHYDAASEYAHGIWWESPTLGSPESMYRVPDGPQAARGKMIVFNKANSEVSWGDWFDQLTTRTPYAENWVVYDSMGMSPEQMLEALMPSAPLVS